METPDLTGTWMCTRSEWRRPHGWSEAVRFAPGAYRWEFRDGPWGTFPNSGSLLESLDGAEERLSPYQFIPALRLLLVTRDHDREAESLPLVNEESYLVSPDEGGLWLYFGQIAKGIEACGFRLRLERG